MSVTRRVFVGSLMAACLPGAWACHDRARGARTARRVLVNHVGFLPGGAKCCLVEGVEPVTVRFADSATGAVAHEAVARHHPGDLGDYCVLDFSSLSRPGSYELHVPGARGPTVAIDERAYERAANTCIGYFAKQRCGDSRTGHHAPCHLDDGRRADDGRARDVVGGWHDACDVRKWVGATIYGMIGLCRVLETLGPEVVDRARVIDELRWGNAYFLKMQEPDGYLMDHCGGDKGNHYTDNQPGTGDDRPIKVDAAEVPAQFQFVAAQAVVVRLTRDDDPDYARTCERAAARCLAWCGEHRRPQTATSLAAGVIACAEMHRAVEGQALRERAAAYARQLLALQVQDPPGGQLAEYPLRGFFRSHPDRPEPAREIMHGNLPLLALCGLLEQFPHHPEAGTWREALRLHAEYVLAMSARSAFGTIPFGLYGDDDAGAARLFAGYRYRWFMKRRGEYGGGASDWWVGINAHLASHGVGLARAARVLGDPRLTAVAQRQLDWILGVNPFDASTVTGLGRNQPPLFETSEYRPPTPPIDGGVMNGIGGSDNDEPRLEPGSYHTCEYWTPMVAYTMWLLAELHASASRPGQPR